MKFTFSFLYFSIAFANLAAGFRNKKGFKTLDCRILSQTQKTEYMIIKIDHISWCKPAPCNVVKAFYSSVFSISHHNGSLTLAYQKIWIGESIKIFVIAALFAKRDYPGFGWYSKLWPCLTFSCLMLLIPMPGLVWLILIKTL